MRILKEINHPACKITIFQWNGKYLIKLEQNDLEQTFKIDEIDILNEEDLVQVLNDEFITSALARFKEMSNALHKATQHLF